MKRNLRLLLLFGLLFAANANAQVVDLNGEYLPDNKLYKSGDVYTNIDGEVGDLYFNSSAGQLIYYKNEYRKRDMLTAREDNISKLALPPYTATIFGYNIYGVENEKVGDLTIPKFYDKNVYWIFYGPKPSTPTPPSIPLPPVVKSDSIELSNNEILSASYSGSFTPVLSEVNYRVECDEKNVNVGEKTTCKVYMNYESYGKNSFIPAQHIFNITSDDYNVSNIKGNFLTSIESNGNHVDVKLISRNVIDMTDEEYEAYLQEVTKYYSSSNTCLTPTGEYFPIPEVFKLQRNDVIGEKAAIKPLRCSYDMSFKDEIQLLTFEIEPKEDASEQGKIVLDNIQTRIGEFTPTGFNYDDIMELESFGQKTIENDIPIVGLVKGVEEVIENPKTGIPNYVYILGIAVLFVVLYYNLIEKKFFKYHE